MQVQSITQTQPDLAAVKARQQQTWASGDYAVIGTTLQLVGESLCEALDLRPGSAVLDVAAGNGNATLAAARRACDVVSTDYVPALLDSARARAGAEGHDVRFEQADAENLPFPDASFDVVLSTFGVMFTPNQEQAAAGHGGAAGHRPWRDSGRLFTRPSRSVWCMHCIISAGTADHGFPVTAACRGGQRVSSSLSASRCLDWDTRKHSGSQHYSVPGAGPARLFRLLVPGC